jgi:mannosyltransferase OCH1-like enzyme
MDIIKINHKEWFDNLFIYKDSNIISRELNNDSGKYIVIDHFLLIHWDKWDKEYFYSDNKIDYYLINEEDNHNKYSFLYLVKDESIHKSIKCIIDLHLNKIYNMNYLEDLGYIVSELSDSINISGDTYIYYQFKYIHKNIFDIKYEILYINQKRFIIEKNRTDYSKYKNRLRIGNRYYQISDHNNNNYSEIKIDEKNLKRVNDKNYKKYKIIISKYNIPHILHIIQHYITFKIPYVIIDDIDNFSYNTLYYDLNILYNNGSYLIDNKNFDIRKLWFSINNEKINRYKYLLNKNLKIFHFIWLGNNKLPEKYTYYVESWIKNHKDSIFCFWNDENIPNLINQKFFDKTDVYAMKADILRYELLYIFGGVYVDYDFLSIRNIDLLIKDYQGFSGYESDEYIAIGLMGFKPSDIILSNIIKKLGENISSNKDRSIPHLSGPIYFTKMWNLYKTDLHYAFPIEYFYSYTFQDKTDQKEYIIKKKHYAIHMWGYSWNGSQLCKSKSSPYLHLANSVEWVNPNSNLIFKPHFDRRKKIVHVMGLFFTGGIERYLYYIDKYGNHEKYNYYLLHISNGSYVYNIQHMKMISFDWDNDYLNDLLELIKPDLIIDHYSIYINNKIYKKDYNIYYFIHSAICYNNDISKMEIKNSIHLYNEPYKNPSWNQIPNHYYLTLGTEMHNLYLKDLSVKDKSLQISIIGRIAEEKLEITFLEKLAKLSNEIYETIDINIYGEKDTIFNKEYVQQFDKAISKSKIKYHNFIDPLNMKDIYVNTDLLLIPSKYETGSFTCIEAFSYGIPVIARNVYGLKHMIMDKVTGYLCDSDEDMLNKIKSCKEDPIFFNREIILKESVKYNITHKIKDLEQIINNSFDKNLVIITSIINTVDNPLSYHDTRSVFNEEDRFNQTLKSIDTIRKYIQNADILFCECSDLSEHFENYIKNNVDYYYNFFKNETICKYVQSEYKGLGERALLLAALDQNVSYHEYKNIFKLSGRYFLNDQFDYTLFDSDKNIFTQWDNSTCSYCTIFYKINSKYMDYYRIVLEKSLDDLSNGNSIEVCMYKFFKENIQNIYKLNVSGFLATEGYLYSV